MNAPDPVAPDPVAPGPGRTARRPAAPLVPEGLAVPLRRGVHRAADLRHRRAAAVAVTHGGRDPGRDRGPARGRRAVRARARGRGAGPRQPRVAHLLRGRLPRLRGRHVVAADHRLAMVRAGQHRHHRRDGRDVRGDAGLRRPGAARRAAGGVERAIADGSRRAAGPARPVGALPGRPGGRGHRRQAFRQRLAAYASAAAFAAGDAVTHAAALGRRPVRVASGYGDPFYPGVQALARALAGSAVVDFGPGCHDGSFFTAQEPPSLAFLAAHLAS